MSDSAGIEPTQLSLLPPPPAAPSSAPAVPVPLPLAQRNLAPDLARGMMLLFIAVANVWGYLYGGPTGYGHRPVDGSTLDHVVDAVVAWFVDDRSRPMFAILYGYGLAMMASRALARGTEPKAVRRLLRRRSWWLVALGTLHATLLFNGDILAPYGVTGLVALMLVGRRSVVLRRWFVVSFVTGMATYLLMAASSAGSEDAAGPQVTAGYLESAVERLIGSLMSTAGVGLLMVFVAPVIVGMALHGAGWLDRPQDHVARLRRVVLWALAVNLVGNAPHALAVAGVWTPGTRTRLALELVHEATGLVMGLGYVCLFALVAVRWRGRSAPAPVRAVAAVGQRSMTCYLLQSVMLAPLLSAWGFGLGGRIGTAAASAIAVTVWLVTIGVAVLLDRAGRRGPFEVLLRRLTYGRPRAAVPSSGPAATVGVLTP
ncbi:DUF418 domain-containing protein [Cellulomonas soli]|nr:DUF418 domain-containing protein [Cellulomonas soli]NYI57776.1 putative membrane protein YeiB [Cellulomonas soli]